MTAKDPGLRTQPLSGVAYPKPERRGRPQRLKEKTGLGVDHIRLAGLHPELVEELGYLGIQCPPTPQDKSRILHAVFHYIEQRSATWSGGEVELRRSLTAVLLQSDYGLSATARGLEMVLWRKKSLWESGGKIAAALLDQRKGRSGKKRRQMCPDCTKLLVAGTVDLDGNAAMAFRRLHTKKAFCAACAAVAPFDPMHKSYVPRFLRQQIMADVMKLLPYRRGPRYAALSGPHIPKKPDLAPGDNFCFDDVSFNLEWCHQEPDAPPQINRGEFLLGNDVASMYPIQGSLISSPIVLPGDEKNSRRLKKAHFTTADCRRALLKAVDDVGLPFKAIVLENGPWRQGFMSDLARGPFWKPVSWNAAEVEMETKLGIRFIYAKPYNPRGKAMTERLIGIMEEFMRGEATFIGFNERMDKREETDEIIRKVKAGTLDWRGLLPSMDQMIRIINKTLEEFVLEKQNGKWLPGVSPQDAWLDGVTRGDGVYYPGIRKRPLRKLPDVLRYYLSTYRRELVVQRTGIEILGHVYFGERLEPFTGKLVEVRCDMEDLSIAYVRRVGSEEFVAVPELVSSAKGDTPEHSQTIAREKAAFTRPARVAYSTLPHLFRYNLVDDNAHGSEEDKAAGRSMADAKAEVVSERDKGAAEMRQVITWAKKAGIPVPERVRNPTDFIGVCRRKVAARESATSIQINP